MTNLRIYNLAMTELLRKKYEVEEPKFKANPNNRITKHRIEVLDKEIDELHEMILIEEHK
jgi:hypothetical protein